MTQPQLVVLASIGGAIFALIAAACLMVFRGAEDQETARRISGLRQGSVIQATGNALQFRSFIVISAAWQGDA